MPDIQKPSAVITPSLPEVQKLVAAHDSKTAMPTPTLMPLSTTLSSDLLTPISAYLRLTQSPFGSGTPTPSASIPSSSPNQGDGYSFLFESVAGGENIGRYSFIGVNPRKVLTVSGEDPLAVLEKEMQSIRVAKLDQHYQRQLPPLTGGAVGFVSYDCVRYFEPRTSTVPIADPLGLPDAVFMFCDTVVVFDHVYQSIKIVSQLHITHENLAQEYERVAQSIQEYIDVLSSPVTPLPPQQPINLNHSHTSNVGADGYKSFVRDLKQHIMDGDIIQAVPSQRIIRPTDLHPFNLYRQLRSLNPSPYMFYVQMKDFQLIGASPELLVKVQDSLVTTHPIAGTRKRGQSPEEDLALEKELLADMKERSEHIMLVDLGRNDVNRVCLPETVKVTSLMHVERYSHVMHIVSNVEGRLHPDKSVFDAFRSIFPAGTVSGAPKVKAMELIYALEKQKRGVYAGAVGYFGYDGNIDTCIAIRTTLMKEGVAYLQAGGGIVYDSEEQMEWEETMNKAGANLRAIHAAEKHWAEIVGEAEK